MNKEIIKAMNKKSKRHPIHDWWSSNSYKVWRIVFFPIWIGTLIRDKINKELNNRVKWDEKRADEILNYYIPRASRWYEDDKTFRYFNNGYGWEMCFAKKYLKRKDKRFWKLHCGWWGDKMRDYLLNKFELEGFEKVVGNCSDGWTEINFKMKD